MSEFSLDLNEDQLQLQKWVHDFAEDVMRPAAHEWDEREETPWPIIEEAARVGLYSFDFSPSASWTRPVCTLPSPTRSWPGATPDRAGHLRQLPRPGRHRRQRHPRAVIEWGPQCFGTPDEAPAGGLLRLGGRRRLRRELARTRAVYDEAKDEWVSTARRPGSPTAASPTSTWWWRPSIPSSARGARRASSSLPARPGSPPARSSRRWASGPRTPARSSSTTCRVPGRCLLGGKEKLDEKLARAREGQAVQAPRPPWPPSRRPGPPSGPRPWASPGPPTSTPSTTPRSARPSGGPSSRTRASPSSSPT